SITVQATIVTSTL
nr:immunoglobulin heavy chain junction region [Mus musculus]